MIDYSTKNKRETYFLSLLVDFCWFLLILTHALHIWDGCCRPVLLGLRELGEEIQSDEAEVKVERKTAERQCDFAFTLWPSRPPKRMTIFCQPRRGECKEQACEGVWEGWGKRGSRVSQMRPRNGSRGGGMRSFCTHEMDFWVEYIGDWRGETRHSALSWREFYELAKAFGHLPWSKWTQHAS